MQASQKEINPAKVNNQISRNPSGKAERDAWSQLLKGEKSGLLSLYDLCYDTMYQYGRRINKDRSIIEDCIQEIFLELWEKRGGLPVVIFVKPYLLKIVKRRLFKVNAARTFEFDNSKSAIEFVESNEDAIIAEENINAVSNRLQHAISKLTKRQREIISLKFFNELSYDEIADYTGLSQQRIYNLVHESIRQLRNNLFALPRHVAVFVMIIFW